MSDIVLEIKSLTRRFGSFTAVDVRRAIGYVPQSVSVDGSLTGYENLLIFAKLYDLPHSEQQARVREALEFMGLTADGGRLVGQYSGGMVRRLEIALSTSEALQAGDSPDCRGPARLSRVDCDHAGPG
jgi:ABC-type multidrug transport system ATPase subunit